MSEKSRTPVYDLPRSTAEQYDKFIKTSLLYQGLYRQLMHVANVQRGDSVLCLAAGTGGDARVAMERGAHVVALDNASSMIQVARERSQGLPVVQADAAALPITSESVNKVLMNAAGEYIWGSIPNLMREVNRVLIPGGIFAFNCQADEIEANYPSDPQRQLRREVAIQGQYENLPVRFSAKPTIDYFKRFANEQGLFMTFAKPIGIVTNLEDAFAQLQLQQFHLPFLQDIKNPQKRLELLKKAYERLKQRGEYSSERFWYHFAFQKQL